MIRTPFCILTCWLTLAGCTSELFSSDDVQPAPISVPFSESVQRFKSLDANGDGVVERKDADWFAELHNAIGAVEPQSHLHYSGLEEPIKTWRKVGFGTPNVRLDAIADLTPEQRYGLSIDAGYLHRSLEAVAAFPNDAEQVLSGSALAGRFISNRDVAEMRTLCNEVATLIPEAKPLPRSEKAVAVFDLDDTVWGGHIMDLGILALAHGGLWSSSALDGTATKLGITASDGVIAIAEAWVSRMRLPYDSEDAISRKDGFFALVAAMKGLRRDSVRDAVQKAFTVRLGNEAPWNERFLGSGQCSLRRWMDLWRSSGGEVLLVSATPDVFVEATQTYLGQEAGTPFRGSQMTEIGGVFNGTLEQSIYATKGAVLREALGFTPWIVFGDSRNSDGPMYDVNFGWSFHINPGKKFPAWDAERGGVVRTLILPQEMSPAQEASLLSEAKR